MLNPLLALRIVALGGTLCAAACGATPNAPAPPVVSPPVSRAPLVVGTWSGTAALAFLPPESARWVRNAAPSVPLTLELRPTNDPLLYDVFLNVGGWVNVKADLTGTLRKDGLALSGTDNRRRDSFCGVQQELEVLDALVKFSEVTADGRLRLRFRTLALNSCYTVLIEVELSSLGLERAPS